MQVPSFGIKSVKSSKEKGAISKITSWICESVENVTNKQIMVTELQCYDPDCVPIETLLIILGDEIGENRTDRWSNKILKPLAEVTLNDVEVALQSYKEKISSGWQEDIRKFVVKLTDDKILNKTMVSEYLLELALELKDSDVVDNTPTTLLQREEISKPSVAQSNVKVTKVTMVRMQPVEEFSESRQPVIISSNESNNRFELKRHYDNLDNIPKQGNSEFTRECDAVSAQVHVLGNSERKAESTEVLTSNTASTLSSSSINSTVNSPSAIPAPNVVPSISFKDQQQAFSSVSSSNNKSKPSKSRHNKDVPRQKGCPCCDPDNLDNLIDKMLFMEYPPN